MTILNISIGLMFALLVGSVSAVYNLMDEFAGDYTSYRDVFCKLRVSSTKNEPIKFLLDEEKKFFQKFFAQLIKSNDSQIIVEKQYSFLEKQYIDGTLDFATAKNDLNQLLGIMFFYKEKDNTILTIQSLSTDNINDTYLYGKLFLGMTELIKNKFPAIRTIRILESTVPENLKSTLKKLGLKSKFIKQKKCDFIGLSVLEIKISFLDNWCSIL